MTILPQFILMLLSMFGVQPAPEHEVVVQGQASAASPAPAPEPAPVAVEHPPIEQTVALCESEHGQLTAEACTEGWMEVGRVNVTTTTAFVPPPGEPTICLLPDNLGRGSMTAEACAAAGGVPD